MTDGLSYSLEVDGDTVALAGDVTLGRHLDNDIVVAGEEVLDFHLRIELTGRGPLVVPLGEAALYINGRYQDEPAGIMPGDRLRIGESSVRLDATPAGAPEADRWRLCAPGDAQGVAVISRLRVGRDPDCDLQPTDPHISRQHARLLNHQGVVWVQDLNSANGTFVNGERIRGARRLFHGDELRFDVRIYQLIGHGADLTPARPLVPGEEVGLHLESVPTARRPSTDTIEFPAVAPAPEVLEGLPDIRGSGAFLVGIEDALAGRVPQGQAQVLRIPMGRLLIGRRDDCGLVLRDPTVSGHHVELVVRPEGATLTDLMSTNGTLCNGRRVQSTRLEDGDVLMLGRTGLVFRTAQTPLLRALRRPLLIALAAGALALLAVLALLL